MGKYKRKADCTPEQWERYKARRRRVEKTYRQKYPDKVRAKERRYYEKLMADPERHAHRLAVVRRSWARRHGSTTAAHTDPQPPRCPAGRVLARILETLTHVPSPDRDDIASEALVALMEGRVSSVEEAVSVGRKAHYRQFSKFKTLSLDCTIGGDSSGARFIDMLIDETIAPIEERICG